jgi:hypothetical protein
MNTKTFTTTVISGLILVSLAILVACSPVAGVPAQPNRENAANIKEETPLSWEIDADDIAAARAAAHYLVGVKRTSHEINSTDISAARDVARVLSQIAASGGMDYDFTELVSGELDTQDIAAAREAANDLVVFQQTRYEISSADISAARQAAHYLAAVMLVSGELDASDITAARQAAETLSSILLAGGPDLLDSAPQKMSSD